MRTSFEEGTYHRQAFKTTKKKIGSWGVLPSAVHHAITRTPRPHNQYHQPNDFKCKYFNTNDAITLINMRELNVVVVGGMESMCMLEGENERERVCICVSDTVCVCVHVCVCTNDHKCAMDRNMGVKKADNRLLHRLYTGKARLFMSNNMTLYMAKLSHSPFQSTTQSSKFEDK